MQKSDLKEWDIVIIDYVDEFTKEHINEGFAIVIWRESSQPLVVKLDDLENGIYVPKWYSYRNLSKVVGRYDFGSRMLEVMEPYKRNIEEKHKTCENCRFSPPSKKWPCVDCDMRYHDRWEGKINER